jgi:hypothetical protein
LVTGNKKLKTLRPSEYSEDRENKIEGLSFKTDFRKMLPT